MGMVLGDAVIVKYEDDNGNKRTTMGEIENRFTPIGFRLLEPNKSNALWLRWDKVISIEAGEPK